MHQDTHVVFDEMINAEGDANGDPGLVLYTSLLHTDFLSEAHQLGLQGIFSAPATSGTMSLQVQIQQSADGRNWLNKNTTPELSGSVTLAPGIGEWSLIGGENWPTLPRLRFVMLVITVTTYGVSPPAARLQVLATARTRTKIASDSVIAPPRTVRMTRREAMAHLLAMHPSTLEEVEAQTRSARAGDGLGRLIDRLSPAAREDLRRVTKVFRALDPQQRRTALTFASALASLAMLPPEEPNKPASPGFQQSGRS